MDFRHCNAIKFQKSEDKKNSILNSLFSIKKLYIWYNI